MAIDVPMIIPFALAGALMLWGVVSAVIAFSGNYDNAGIPKIYSSVERTVEMPENFVENISDAEQKPQSENQKKEGQGRKIIADHGRVH